MAHKSQSPAKEGCLLDGFDWSRMALDRGYRGLLGPCVLAAYPRRRGNRSFSCVRSDGWFAIFVSAIFFSLSHFQYHAYHLTPAAIAQAAYTLPMGITFGYLRERSDSLWPGIVIHFLNNGLALLR
jgi:hypothetical protein